MQSIFSVQTKTKQAVSIVSDREEQGRSLESTCFCSQNSRLLDMTIVSCSVARNDVIFHHIEYKDGSEQNLVYGTAPLFSDTKLRGKIQPGNTKKKFFVRNHTFKLVFWRDWCCQFIGAVLLAVQLFCCIILHSFIIDLV